MHARAKKTPCPNRPKFRIVQGRGPRKKEGIRGGNGIHSGLGFLIRGSPNLVRSAPRSPTHFLFFFQRVSMMTMPPQMLCSKQGMSQKILLIINNTFVQMLRSCFFSFRHFSRDVPLSHLSFALPYSSLILQFGFSRSR